MMSATRVLSLWLLLAGLTAGAYYGLPRYLDSLDQRILFADPDCMQVAGTRANEARLSVQARGDSLRIWTRKCLNDRQERMIRHADIVGWSTTIGLGLASVLITALTLAWIWGRLRPKPSVPE